MIAINRHTGLPASGPAAGPRSQQEDDDQRNEHCGRNPRRILDGRQRAEGGADHDHDKKAHAARPLRYPAVKPPAQ